MDSRLGFMRERPRESQEALRWFVGVPVGTNVFFLMDLAAFLVAAWAVTFLSLLALQRLTAGHIFQDHLTAAFQMGLWMDGVFTAIFLIAAFPFLKNRYAAYYHLEEWGVRCENLRCSPQALGGNWRLRWRPWAIEPVLDPARAVERQVPWNHVRSVQALPEMATLLLRGRWGTVMRVYCPDEATFRRALDFSRSHVPQERP